MLVRKTNEITLVSFLSIDVTSPENRLLFVSGLNLAEKIFDFRILFQTKENAVHLQYSLGNQFFSVKLRQILIARIAQTFGPLRRRVFQRISAWHSDRDPVDFPKGVRKVNRKLSIHMFEGVHLPGLKKIYGHQQTLANRGSIAWHLHAECCSERTIA